MSSAVRAALIVGVAGLAGSALARPINYGDYFGSNIDFIQVTEDSSTETPGTPVFGAPTLSGNALLWFPTTYSSFSQNGSADSTNGVLTVSLRSRPGEFIKSVTISEIGDYSLSGVGTASTFASVSSSMFAFAPQNGINYGGALTVTPKATFIRPIDSAGPWTAKRVIDVTGLGITQLDLTFSSTLSTGSESGTTAFIQKKQIGGPTLRIEVPAPGSLALVGLGGLAALRRRRA